MSTQAGSVHPTSARVVQTASGARWPDGYAPCFPSAASRWTVWDILGIAAGFLLAWLASLALGHGRAFWEDETLGWMMLRDPSWRHMIAAWNLGADGGGFSFYLTGRIWFALFGDSANSFRLYSATCFGVGFAAVWAAARRWYRPGPIAFALFTLWFFSPEPVTHMAEGRFYGLLVAAVGIAAYVFLWSAARPRQDGWACAATFLAHSLLTTSHLLGVVYSFFLLLGTVALDRISHRWRPLLYLSGAAGWLWLLPSLKAIRASAAVGKPHFWTIQPPSLEYFLAGYTGFTLRIAALIGVLLAAIGVRYLSSAARRASFLRQVHRRLPVYCATAAIFLVPIAFWIEGHFGTPVFVYRYLVPINVGTALFLAECITLVDFPAWPGQTIVRPSLRILFTGYLALLCWYDFGYVSRFALQQPDYTQALTAELPNNIPIVCEDVFSFTELMWRNHNGNAPFVFILDWPDAIRPHAPMGEVTQYHLMENWKKAGYFPEHVQQRNVFLAHTPVFLVLESEVFFPQSLARPAHYESRTTETGETFAKYLAEDPAYQVRPYKGVLVAGLRENLTLVCRKTVQPCTPQALGLP